MNTHMEYALEHLGAEATERLVQQRFSGRSEAAIKTILDGMFPGEENALLVAEIALAVRGVGRPPAAGTRRQGRITITLPPEMIEALQSRGNVSAFIREAIARMLVLAAEEDSLFVGSIESARLHDHALSSEEIAVRAAEEKKR